MVNPRGPQKIEEERAPPQAGRWESGEAIFGDSLAENLSNPRGPQKIEDFLGRGEKGAQSAMKLSQLRYFCEACRVNNITQAAKNLYVSQSAVSVQIKELEEEFDVRLFVRDNNRLQLTEARQKLWKHAQQILRQADQVSLEMAELKNRSGRLRVNLTPSCIPCILPLLGETFRQLRDKYPNVELQIQEEPAGGAAAQLLLEGRADLALMSMAKEPPRQLESETLYSSALLACVSRRHPLAFGQTVGWRQLAQYPLALTASTRAVLESLRKEGLLKQYGLELDYRFVFSQPSALEQLVEKDFGVGVAAHGIFMPKSDRVKLLPLEPPIPFHLGVFWSKKATLSDQACFLLQLICAPSFHRQVRQIYG